ncbi:sulfotransferase [uncultured Roseibium sp.]|uniref:sulfotransferase n=1 Tax=uncultured Roseibium sp. TaxID=1936171 RepID=UPI002638DD30|nr:sulfotransferase [uncultured Roseibium sp.]
MSNVVPLREDSFQLHRQYPSLYFPKDGYVFVVAFGRSGSTLTQHLLNSLPGYFVRGENCNALVHLSRSITAIRGEGNFQQRQEPQRSIISSERPYFGKMVGTSLDPWYGMEDVDVDEYALSLFDTFVSKVLCPKGDARVLGFKEIRYHNDPRYFSKFLDTILTYFPKSRFIFQNRTFENVVKSSFWKKQDQSDVRRKWENFEDLTKSYAANNKDVCYQLRYEDYLEGAEKLEPLFKFLKEPFEAAEVAKLLETKLKH